jgi:hypothetical protein
MDCAGVELSLARVHEFNLFSMGIRVAYSGPGRVRGKAVLAVGSGVGRVSMELLKRAALIMKMVSS